MSDLAVKHEAPANAMEIRQEILDLEKRMMALPESERFHQIPVHHEFTDGIYTRTCFMKKGELIVGKIHKLEHIVVISCGRAQVASEEFGSKILNGPLVFRSPPGVKRTLLIEEDMIWTTIHPNPTNTRDLKELEEYLIMKEYGEATS